MSAEKKEKHEIQYTGDDRYATQKDLEILSLKLGAEILNVKMELKLEIEKRINVGVYKLGGFIVFCFGLFTWYLPHLIVIK